MTWPRHSSSSLRSEFTPASDSAVADALKHRRQRPVDEADERPLHPRNLRVHYHGRGTLFLTGAGRRSLVHDHAALRTRLCARLLMTTFRARHSRRLLGAPDLLELAGVEADAAAAPASFDDCHRSGIGKEVQGLIAARAAQLRNARIRGNRCPSGVRCAEKLGDLTVVEPDSPAFRTAIDLGGPAANRLSLHRNSAEWTLHDHQLPVAPRPLENPPPTPPAPPAAQPLDRVRLRAAAAST